VENNFTGGLKTEFTGLNFPENACTQTENCVFSLIGDVTRRGGFDYEPSSQINPFPAGGAHTTYRWRNAGGDGQSEILVQQTNNIISFFLTSAAGTSNTGISQNILSTSLDLNSFLIAGNPIPDTQECQYSDGNGFLFIFHPYCSPVYVTYTPSTAIINYNAITINIRDLDGIPDSLGVQGNASSLTTRPATLSNEHNYNLQNQGWTETAGWAAASNPAAIIGSTSNNNVVWFYNLPSGNYSFANVASAITPTPTVGQTWQGSIHILISYFNGGHVLTTNQALDVAIMGTVVSYSGTTLVLNIPIAISLPTGYAFDFPHTIATITAEAAGFQQTNVGSKITTWNTAIKNYPSNADIWWQFKDTTNVFNPSVASILNVTLANTRAPAGHFILDAFFQDRTAASGIPNIQAMYNSGRPSTGAFFAGRVWYSGASVSSPSGGDAPAYTWTENIYYSQIVGNQSDFGRCYSVNDPTDETFFSPLSTDGGIIIIQGTGAIYKLFPIANGLLVMAQNGIWLISGSAGFGFDPTSYLISQISKVKILSPSSIVDVLGLPFFWNLEGIYSVQLGQEKSPYGHGGLTVNPLTVGTILSFYNNIPQNSKLYAKAAYNPITYVIQWLYRSTNESDIGNRYVYDSALSLNIFNKAFYPYIISNKENSTANLNISGIVFMDYPSSTTLDPQFKYTTFVPTGGTYSEENNFTTYTDWVTAGFSTTYTSTFTTGYKLHGQAFKRWMPIYMYLFSRNAVPTSYQVQAIWDFNVNALGRTSNVQTVVNWNPEFGMLYRRHKLRGHGLAVQFKITSVDGQPFDFMGWAVPEEQAMGA
jgi:hypothetical protein